MSSKPALAGLWILLLAGMLAAGGCGQESPTTLEELRQLIAAKLPKGWKVGYASQAPFPLIAPTAGQDLVVYRAEPVVLQPAASSTQPAGPGYIHFSISPKPFIAPTEYRQKWKANEAIRKDHERVLHTVRNIPRSINDELMPRDGYEAEAVSKFKAKYAALPPFDKDMPTHYYGTLAVVLRDWRTRLVPESREMQQDMNQAYALLNTILSRYSTSQ